MNLLQPPRSFNDTSIHDEENNMSKDFEETERKLKQTLQDETWTGFYSMGKSYIDVIMDYRPAIEKFYKGIDKLKGKKRKKRTG